MNCVPDAQMACVTGWKGVVGSTAATKALSIPALLPARANTQNLTPLHVSDEALHACKHMGDVLQHPIAAPNYVSNFIVAPVMPLHARGREFWNIEIKKAERCDLRWPRHS